MTTKTTKKYQARINMTPKQVLTLAASSRAANSAGGLLDEFQILRQQVEQEFVLLNEGQEVDLARILDSEDFAGNVKKAAGQILFRAHAPTALMMAVEECRKQRGRLEFGASASAANAALWSVIGRWYPEKGMSLSAFVAKTLGQELRRQLADSEGLGDRAWKIEMVKSALFPMLEKFQTLWHAGFNGVKLEAEQMEALEALFQKGLFQKEVKKANNKVRVWDRAITGYHKRELVAAKEQLLEMGIKLTSRYSLKHVFARPGIPVRRENVTPKMVLGEMRMHRAEKGIQLGKEWTEHLVQILMDSIFDTVSYDVTVNEDSEESFADLFLGYEVDFDRDRDQVTAIAAEERFGAKVQFCVPTTLNVRPSKKTFVQFDKNSVQPEFKINNWYLVEKAALPEFSDIQLAEADFIKRKLMESGLWEIAMNLPIDKFLAAYDDSVKFAKLVHAYGVRFKFARDICKIVNLHLTQTGRDKATRLGL